MITENEYSVLSHVHLIYERESITDIHKVYVPLVALVLNQEVKGILLFVVDQKHFFTYLGHLSHKLDSRLQRQVTRAHVNALNQILRDY